MLQPLNFTAQPKALPLQVVTYQDCKILKLVPNIYTVRNSYINKNRPKLENTE